MNVPVHIIKFIRKYNKLVTFQDGFISATNNHGVIVTYQFEYENDGVYSISDSYDLIEQPNISINYLDQPIRLLANSKRAGIDVSRFMCVKSFTNTYSIIKFFNISFHMHKLALYRAMSPSQWKLKRDIYYAEDYLVISYLEGTFKIFLPIFYKYIS